MTEDEINQMKWDAYAEGRNDQLEELAPIIYALLALGVQHGCYEPCRSQKKSVDLCEDV
jgi:hypothetical protein